MAALLLIGAAALAFAFTRKGGGGHVLNVGGVQTFDQQSSAAIRSMLAFASLEIVQTDGKQITFRVKQVAAGVTGAQALDLAKNQGAAVAGSLALADMALSGKGPSGDVFLIAFQDASLTMQIAGTGKAFAIVA